MCGIVGYSGPQNAIVPVVEGLTRLEYRGYDSAGICFDLAGDFRLLKEVGKIDNLKITLKKEDPHSHVAIGHTRWATHGGVNELNAHPHLSENFSVVHNGIIENATEIKKDLISKGYIFKSETDSESFVVLLSHHFKQLKNVKDAILKTFSQIQGNSAFVIMTKGSQTLYSIKRSAPLVCGDNQNIGEVFVSSDPYALVGFAERLYFPENEVLCEAMVVDGAPKINFYELDGTASNRYKIKNQDKDVEVATKGQFEHFMLKEIYEQPSLIAGLVEHYLVPTQKMTEIKASELDFVHIIGCGTAWHAGLLIKSFLEKEAKLRVACELASEFRYREPILHKKDLGLFISQSGETADTLACQEQCRENHLKTVSIVNVEGSTIFRNCDENFLIKAGSEIGVASTKAFTLQVLTGHFLAHALGGEWTQTIDKMKNEAKVLSSRIQDILNRVDEIKEIAEQVYQSKGFIFTGRGDFYPVALEGALKLKEIAYVHAEGYAAGELKHGPIALIDESMLNIALVAPHLYDKTISNVEEVKARRGLIFAVGPQNDEHLRKISDYYFGVDFKGLDQLAPVMANVVLQLFSYYIAKIKGTDIDKPRNLAKSVTVE